MQYSSCLSIWVFFFLDRFENEFFMECTLNGVLVLFYLFTTKLDIEKRKGLD